MRSRKLKIPEGWKKKTILLRPSGVANVTNEMKWACIGEFKTDIDVVCDHDGMGEENCANCDGEGFRKMEVTIPWDTVKDIFKAMVEASPLIEEPKSPDYSVSQLIRLKNLMGNLGLSTDESLEAFCADADKQLSRTITKVEELLKCL